jgi:hypothetical protein
LLRNKLEGKVGKHPFITMGAAIGCSLAIALSMAAVLYVFTHGTQRGHDTCRAALDVRDAVVRILQDADSESSNTANAERAHLFYTHSINKLEKVDC